MKKQHYILITVLFISINFSLAQITFQKTYGGSGEEIAYSVQQTNDSGFIIVGSTTTFSTNSIFDAYVIKTNSYGDTLWTKVFGGIGFDYARSVQQTADGGYIILGYTNSFVGDDDFYLIKLDSSGNFIWSKTIGSQNLSKDDLGYSIQQTTDGGYIMTGAYSNLNPDIYLIKTNDLGDTLWSKRYGGNNPDYGSSVRQTADGGYIVTGTSASNFGTGGADVSLIRTNSIGDTLWVKSYGGFGNPEYGNCVRQTLDGGFIVAGEGRFIGVGVSDVFLIKTDTMGNILWSKTYGGGNNDWANAIELTEDSGYIIVGYTTSFGGGSIDAYLIKTNSNGDTLWTKTYGGLANDNAFSVGLTFDGGFIIAGQTNSFGSGGSDFYLIKTDSLGNSNCNIHKTYTITTPQTPPINYPLPIISSGVMTNIPPTQVHYGGIVNNLCSFVGIDDIYISENVSLYPNPFTLQTTISFKEEQKNTIIKILDVLGNEIMVIKFTGKQFILEKGDLQPGIYFVQTIDERKNMLNRKIIIE